MPTRSRSRIIAAAGSRVRRRSTGAVAAACAAAGTVLAVRLLYLFAVRAVVVGVVDGAVAWGYSSDVVWYARLAAVCRTSGVVERAEATLAGWLVEQAVGEEFDAVGRQEPDDCVAPDEQRVFQGSWVMKRPVTEMMVAMSSALVTAITSLRTGRIDQNGPRVRVR